jgi:uncharacterized membrane protein YphA (DoxX/SURF4 family)
MKLNQPIANALYGPLWIRLSLGAYFILAGMMKLNNPESFLEEIKKFGILREPILTLYGILLPYLEIFGGTLLLLGFFTTLASLLCSLMLLSFIIALKLFPNGGDLYNKDVILLGACLSLLFTGGGFFSLDHFRKSG